MIHVITFEVPYSPLWEKEALHSLIHSAVEAANEAPVVLRTSKEWAEKVYGSDLVELFVDYFRLDAELPSGEWVSFHLKDGPLPEEWELVFNEIIEAQDGVAGLYRQADS